MFRIASNDNDTPALFETHLFRTISPTVSSNWIAVTDETGSVTIGPKEWARPGFWDEYFDAIPKAVEVFDREKRRMFEEEQQESNDP
jgi:hypothetical protein